LPLLATGVPAFAEDGVSADKIVFGQATGARRPRPPALGQGHEKWGFEAALRGKQNKAGGVCQGPESSKLKERRRRLRADQVDLKPVKEVCFEEDKGVRNRRGGRYGPTVSPPLSRSPTAAGAPFIGAFTGG